ncbi:MAG: radical SAM protein [Ferruginibacter sp.]
MWRPKKVQFVVKLTKLCNLRCKYCYEYPYLGDTTKIELREIEKMLHNIAEGLIGRDVEECEFILHGGEPFLLSADYYRAVYARQKEILGKAGIRFQNVIQSNLTNLKEEHIQLIKDEIISSVGVSIDLFGDERVNIAGKNMDEKTLRNMEWLFSEGIGFSAISVLSKKTAPHIKKMFSFFSRSNISWRILPIDLVGFDGQHDNNVLSADEICTVFKTLFEEWLRSPNAIKLEPLNEYIDAAIASLNNSNTHRFNKETEDSLFIVNTNGDVYSEADAYDTCFTYGNIFTDPFDELLNSPARSKAIARANLITGSTCDHCVHYGYCNGFRMAESTTEKLYWHKDGNISCAVIKPMIDYIKDRLQEEKVMELYASAFG